MQVEEFQALKSGYQTQINQPPLHLGGHGVQQENGESGSFPRSPDTSTCDANNADLLMDEMMKMREEARSPYLPFTSKSTMQPNLEDMHLNGGAAGNLSQPPVFKVIACDFCLVLKLCVTQLHDKF